MRTTLLEFVQSILSDMDSEPVNSINDSIEALQIASVIEDTFYNFVSARKIPEHQQLIKLTALADSNYPTHFEYVGEGIEIIRYNIDPDAGEVNYRTIKYLHPTRFLELNNHTSTSNTMLVSDKNAGTNIVIRTDIMPTYYTSFDDKYVVMDGYDSTVDDTLQESKIQAWGTVIPAFTTSDTYVIDADETVLPYLMAEAKSACFSLFKGGPDPKVEQSARRLKSYIQNDMYRSKMTPKRPTYGRQ